MTHAASTLWVDPSLLTEESCHYVTLYATTVATSPPVMLRFGLLLLYAAAVHGQFDSDNGFQYADYRECLDAPATCHEL